MNLACRLYTVSSKLQNETALMDDGLRLTYGELWDRIDRLSHALTKLGIKQGDNVAIILPSGTQFIEALFSIFRINAVAIPLEPIFTPREYNDILFESDPVAVFTNSHLARQLLGYEEGSTAPETILAILKDIRPAPGSPRVYVLDDLYKVGIRNHHVPSTANDSPLATINYTYRGYGYAVGALITHDNYFDSIAAFSDLTNYGRYLSLLPMAHVFSLLASVLTPLLFGRMAVVTKSRSARHIFQTIEDYGVEFMSAVPVVYHYLAKRFERNTHDISSLRCAISGGNYLPSSDNRTLQEALGVPIYQGYGLTEGLIVACNREPNDHLGSLGRLGSGITAQVVDSSGLDVGRNALGEIAVKGPNVMSGFFRRHQQTAEVLQDGWLRTGDLGTLDDAGYLHFQGLKKSIAKVGGRNADLLEIENVLREHPRILEAHAYAAPDPLWGQKVGVHITPAEKLAESDIRDFCRGKLSSYKIPSHVTFV